MSLLKELERNQPPLEQPKGVLVDTGSETLLTLRAATEHLPRLRSGKRVHVATLYRWAQRGLRGIRLETIQVGGTLCTSQKALQRFFERLSGARTDAGNEPPHSSRRRSLQKVEQELDRLGL